MTVTIVQMFNSVRWPFEQFETEILIVFHLQEGKISSLEVLKQ